MEEPLLILAGSWGNEVFGSTLRGLRLNTNLTPKELAQLASVHESFIHGIERGAQAPSKETAQLILSYVGEQDRIIWCDDGSCDLLIDDFDGKKRTFVFKAEVKGQNKRPLANIPVPKGNSLTNDQLVRVKALELAMSYFEKSSSTPLVTRAKVFEAYIRGDDIKE